VVQHQTQAVDGLPILLCHSTVSLGRLEKGLEVWPLTESYNSFFKCSNVSGTDLSYSWREMMQVESFHNAREFGSRTSPLIPDPHPLIY
jgi:hypothetical protein